MPLALTILAIIAVSALGLGLACAFSALNLLDGGR